MFSDDQLLRGEFDSAAYLRYILHVTSGLDTNTEQRRLELLMRQIDDKIEQTLSGTDERKRVLAYLINEVKAVRECGEVMSSVNKDVSLLRKAEQRLESLVEVPYCNIRNKINQVEHAQCALHVMKAVNKYLSCANQIERLLHSLNRSEEANDKHNNVNITESKANIQNTQENTNNNLKSEMKSENGTPRYSALTKSTETLQSLLRVARLLHEMEQISLSLATNTTISNCGTATSNNSENDDNNNNSNVISDKAFDINKIDVVERVAKLRNDATMQVQRYAEQILEMGELQHYNDKHHEVQSKTQLPANNTTTTTTSTNTLNSSSIQSVEKKMNTTGGKPFTSSLASENVALVNKTLNEITLALQCLHLLGVLPESFRVALQRHTFYTSSYINQHLHLERFINLLEQEQEHWEEEEEEQPTQQRKMQQMQENKSAIYNKNNNNSSSSSSIHNDKKKKKIVDFIENYLANVVHQVRVQTQMIMLLWQAMLENDDVFLEFHCNRTNNMNNSRTIVSLLDNYWKNVLLLFVSKLQIIFSNEHINRRFTSNYTRLRGIIIDFFFIPGSASSTSSLPLSFATLKSYLPSNEFPQATSLDWNNLMNVANTRTGSHATLAFSALTQQNCTVSTYALLIWHIVQRCYDDSLVQSKETKNNDNNNSNNVSNVSTTTTESPEMSLLNKYSNITWWQEQLLTHFNTIVYPVEQHYVAVNLNRHRQAVNKILARLAMLTPASSLLAQQVVRVSSLHKLIAIISNSSSNDDSNNYSLSSVANMSTPSETTSLNVSQYSKMFVHETYYIRHDFHTLSLITENVAICLSQLSSKLYEVYKYCVSKLVIDNGSNTLPSIVTSSSEFAALMQTYNNNNNNNDQGNNNDNNNVNMALRANVNEINRLNLLFFNLVNACAQIVNDIDQLLRILPFQANPTNANTIYHALLYSTNNNSYNNSRYEQNKVFGCNSVTPSNDCKHNSKQQMITKVKLEHDDHAMLLQRRNQLEQLRSTFVKLSNEQILEPIFRFAEKYFIKIIQDECAVEMPNNLAKTENNISDNNIISNREISPHSELQRALFTFVARIGVYINSSSCVDWIRYTRTLTQELFQEFVQSFLTALMENTMHESYVQLSQNAKEHNNSKILESNINTVDTTNNNIQKESRQINVDKFRLWLYKMRIMTNSLKEFAHITQPAGLQRGLIILLGVANKVVRAFEMIINMTQEQKTREIADSKLANNNDIYSEDVVNVVELPHITNTNVESEPKEYAQTAHDASIDQVATQIDKLKERKADNRKFYELSAIFCYLSEMKVITRLLLLCLLQLSVFISPLLDSAEEQKVQHQEEQEQEHEQEQQEQEEISNTETSKGQTAKLFNKLFNQLTNEENKRLIHELIKQELYVFALSEGDIIDINTCDVNLGYTTNSEENNSNNKVSSISVDNNTQHHLVAMLDDMLQQIFATLSVNVDVTNVTQAAHSTTLSDMHSYIMELYISWRKVESSEEEEEEEKEEEEEEEEEEIAFS